MARTFVYCYLMTNDVARIRALAPAHAAYWKSAGLKNYRGGPFSDRSGGLIIFDADDSERAENLARQDPFVREEVVAERWLREWSPE